MNRGIKRRMFQVEKPTDVSTEQDRVHLSLSTSSFSTSFVPLPLCPEVADLVAHITKASELTCLSAPRHRRVRGQRPSGPASPVPAPVFALPPCVYFHTAPTDILPDTQRLTPSKHPISSPRTVHFHCGRTEKREDHPALAEQDFEGDESIRGESSLSPPSPLARTPERVQLFV